MSAILHAVWPRTPGTRLRLRPVHCHGPRHVVELLSACAGLAPDAGEPLDVLYVHLPGGDDLFRLASRTGGRLGPAGCVPGVRMRARGAAGPVDFADLGVVAMGPRLTAPEARTAARMARELACRRVLFVLPAGRHAGASATALASACRRIVPDAIVETGSFTPWGRQPDYVVVNFDAPPEDSRRLAA